MSKLGVLRIARALFTTIHVTACPMVYFPDALAHRRALT